MRGNSNWSYQPYRHPLHETGDIYICRIAPTKDKIHVEWYETDLGPVEVYYKLRDENIKNEGNIRVEWFRVEGGKIHKYETKRELNEFILAGTVEGNAFDIENLIDDTEYEILVKAGEKRSRVRLVRTGDAIGVAVINYLHPEDRVYEFSGGALCSPSLVRHPDGYLLASMDMFAGGYPQNFTLIYRSDDDGKTWHYVSELMPCFWGKLFVHKGELYMLGCSTEYGDLLISKSVDGGKTFPAPVCLLHGANGKAGSSGCHKNPQNIVYYNGRLYETMEWAYTTGTGTDWNSYRFAAMVMSIDENDDLLVAENWSFSEPVKFDPNFAPEVNDMPESALTIEGTLVVAPDGKLYNIMRFSKNGHAIVYEVDTENPEGPLKYSRIMEFPAHLAKFMIKYDDVSKKYYTIGCHIYDYSSYELSWARNMLVLYSSEDLVKWDIAKVLYDYRHVDHMKMGMQYVDFSFEGEDIIFQIRTAMNEPRDFHDANYSIFDRLENFRTL